MYRINRRDVLASVVIVLVSGLTLIAASFIQLNSPSRTLQSIVVSEPKPGYVGQYKGLVCFGVISEFLWEPGNQADDLDSYLLAHIQFSLDGQLVATPPDSQFISNFLGAKYDAQGKFLGTYGGSIRTCFQPYLAIGFHVAGVEVSTTSGVVHKYEWSFLTF